MTKNSPAKILILITFMALNISGYAQEKINEIKIGEQVWMAENLNVEKFQNGDPVPQAKTSEEWVQAAENEKPAWCYYDFDPSNGEKYGKLYNWYAVDDRRGLAPKGWHVASTLDWDALAKQTGGDSYAGAKLKTKTGWLKNGNGENSSGFSALPGGFCDQFGNFYELGEEGYWWTSEAQDDMWGIYYNLCNRTTILVESHYHEMKDGFSVRCVKD